jgi:hypothetical protein
MNHISLEALPVNLLAILLNESPVLREGFVAGTDGNLRGMEDMSKDAPVLYAPESRDLIVELFEGSYRLLRLHQPALKPLPRVSYPGVLVHDGLPQTLKLDFAVVGHDILARNVAHDGLECVLVGFAAKKDDLATRRFVSLAVVELVIIFARRENNMAGRKEEDPIAFAAFAEVETTGTFEVRVGIGSDFETECGSEWAAYVDGWIKGEDVVEESRAGGPGEDRLAERNLNASDLRVCESLLTAHRCVLCVLTGESPGHHAHPKEKGTGFLSNFSEADRVDACPPEANRIKVLVDLST